MFFFTKGYKAINPCQILLFYFFVFTYLVITILIFLLGAKEIIVMSEASEIEKHQQGSLYRYYFQVDEININFQYFYHIAIHLNPINLILKFMILKFDLFTEIAIEVQKYLNTRIYDFNPPNINENYQLRYYSWVTNTTETDKDILREMFIPTQKELQRNM